MNNIFENAYFGKVYKTRDGRKALYIKYNKDSYDPEIPHQLVYEGGGNAIQVDNNGSFWGKDRESCDDIISEWKEEIDKEELDKLAYDLYPDLQLSYGEVEPCDDLRDAFKAGYRKAKKCS